MNFLPRDICEKLVKLGCKSESFLWWLFPSDDIPVVHQISNVDYHENLPKGMIPAFIFQDFCGISELARKNAEVIFGNATCQIDSGYGYSQPRYIEARQQMLDMTEGEWVEFMRRAVG